jgi:UDP-2-acetamido-2,6-beta-L-arabino-hexul-4-ose reductase
MKTILVTGAAGFIGKHVTLALRRSGGFEVIEYTSGNDPSQLPAMIARCQFVIHLAGVNRPKDESEFVSGNAEFTRELCRLVAEDGRKIPVAMSSSIQAERDNPYGNSKRMAEEALLDHHRTNNAPVYLYRLPNVFGKWSRPQYNTVVATFCHNISRGLPVTISDPSAKLSFVYIDDVINELVKLAGRDTAADEGIARDVSPVHYTTLGGLHDLILSFRNCRDSSTVPDLGNPLTKCLYSTYLSFLDNDDFARPVDLKTDERGWLFELVKSKDFGQIFVSKTKPGITRGNHYHDTKVEKFCVIQGQGVIRFRNVLGDHIIEYTVSDKMIKVVDIPPGLTHSIENTGADEMLTLFWTNEIFDPKHPDTHFVNVLP